MSGFVVLQRNGGMGMRCTVSKSNIPAFSIKHSLNTVQKTVPH